MIATDDTIVDKIIVAKYASNCFQAAHIATSLKLWELSTDEERMKRVALYRTWRSSQVFHKDDTASCFRMAIEGKEPPHLDIIEIDHPKPVHVIDDEEGNALADYFGNLEETE
jgi:hypothetical protein